ncbi:unnamed protein product [Tilletia caries]|nr:unnamed protein product [Tilletia caries]
MWFALENVDVWQRSLSANDGPDSSAPLGSRSTLTFSFSTQLLPDDYESANKCLLVKAASLETVLIQPDLLSPYSFCPAYTIRHSNAMLSPLRIVSSGAAALIGATLLLFGRAQAQNEVDIVGTWSSGAGNVVTGLQFFNPTNNSFIPPRTAGRSYSFTSDGHWEQAIFQYIPQPAKPNCVKAQLIWQHGTYTRNNNGSLTLKPFAGDGHQQIKTMCGEVSDSVQYYEETELISQWSTSLVRHYGSPAYALQLYAFDGSPIPVLYQIYNPPQMLPTQQLHQQIIGKPYKK